MKRISIIVILVVILLLAACQSDPAQDMEAFCADLAAFNQAYAALKSLDENASEQEIKDAMGVLATAAHELEQSGKKLDDPVVDEFISAAKDLNTALQYLPENATVDSAFLAQSLASVSQERQEFEEAYATVNQTMCPSP